MLLLLFLEGKLLVLLPFYGVCMALIEEHCNTNFCKGFTHKLYLIARSNVTDLKHLTTKVGDVASDFATSSMLLGIVPFISN